MRSFEHNGKETTTVHHWVDRPHKRSNGRGTNGRRVLIRQSQGSRIEGDLQKVEVDDG